MSKKKQTEIIDGVTVIETVENETVEAEIKENFLNKMLHVVKDHPKAVIGFIGMAVIGGVACVLGKNNSGSVEFTADDTLDFISEELE